MGNAIYTIDKEKKKYHWQSITTTRNPHSGYADFHPSIVKLADGRILYMYSRGSERGDSPSVLYQAYIQDLDIFLNNNDTVTEEIPVMTDIYRPRATLFYSPAGELFYIVSYTRTVGSNVAKTEIYKSAYGDGSDWNLYGTVQNLDRAGTSSGNEKYNHYGVAVPYFKNGLWIICAPNYYQLDSRFCGNHAIWTSGDGGLTWGLKYQRSFGNVYNPNGYFSSRNFGEINGVLWWACAGHNIVYRTIYVKSTDGGATWESAIDYETSDMYATIVSDADNLYAGIDRRLSSGTTNIYKAVSSPTAFSDFEDTGIDLKINGENLVIIGIDDKLVLLSYNINGVQVGDTDMSFNLSRVRNLRTRRNSWIKRHYKTVYYGQGDDTDDWKEPGEVYTRYQHLVVGMSTLDSQSYVQLDDGRILFMHTNGDYVRQAYISDLNTFISQDNYDTPTETLFGGESPGDNPRTTLFRAPDGGLYFVMAHTGTRGSWNAYAKLQIYKSPLGDGSDWELYKEMQSYRYGGYSTTNLSARFLPVSVPYFIGSRWVLAHIDFISGLSGQLAISTSDDSGITWTKRETYSYSPAASDYVFTGSRNFGYIDGELWWSYVTMQHGPTYDERMIYFVKSTDNGETWTDAFSKPFIESDKLGSTIFSDNGKLYNLQFFNRIGGESANNDNQLLACDTSPNTFYDFYTIETNIPVGMGGYETYDLYNILAVKCGDKLVISDGKAVIGVCGNTEKRINL